MLCAFYLPRSSRLWSGTTADAVMSGSPMGQRDKAKRRYLGWTHCSICSSHFIIKLNQETVALFRTSSSTQSRNCCTLCTRDTYCPSLNQTSRDTNLSSSSHHYYVVGQAASVSSPARAQLLRFMSRSYGESLCQREPVVPLGSPMRVPWVPGPGQQLTVEVAEPAFPPPCPW